MFLLGFVCLLLQACNFSSNHHHNGSSTGAITIVSPEDGSTHDTSTPVTIKVAFASGADAAAMQLLLDGVDITSQFTMADSGGVRQATVNRPAVNLGKNQILVRSRSQRATSDFFLSATPLGSAGSPTLGQGHALPLLVPIKTRVVTGDGSKATDYNIALYKNPDDPTAATLIQAPALDDGSNTGFQIVYLKRTDLSVMSNVSVSTAGSTYTFKNSPLNSAFVPAVDCGAAGCIEIVQSLGKIGHVCNPNAFDDCNWLSAVLSVYLGVSDRLQYANGQSNQIEFSSISNAGGTGASAGDFFESLTCSGSNYGGGPKCDTLGYPNTSFTAPKNATASQLGAISGALIRDNYDNFTFVQTRRPVAFSIVTDANGPNGLTNTVTVDGVPYVSQPLNGATGGFHLVILKSTNLHPTESNSNRTFPSSGDGAAAQKMADVIGGYKSYPFLFFIAAYGDTSYFCQSNSGQPCAARGRWYQVSQLMKRLGGTQQVFYQANNPFYEVENPDKPRQYDDYTLVGSFVDGVGGPAKDTGLTQYGAEMSSVIDRETLASPPPAGPGHGEDMDGFLAVNNQGFYAPKNFGQHLNASNVASGDVLAASKLNPVAWPFPGPDPAKAKAAYDWISLQLCCTDIRAAYVNLNISPGIWLAQLRQLTYDASKIPGSGPEAFEAMQDQLAKEFQYVTLVRVFQSNLVGLFQDQQANISLLFQDDFDKVTNSLQIDLSTKAHSASWTAILENVFSVGTSLLNLVPGGGEADVGADVIAAGVEVALTVGAAAASEATEHTNTPAGTPIQGEEREEIAAGNMADKLASNFAATLVSMGDSFDRIVSDWGRLKTLGGPLLANQIPWDGSTSGLILRAFDRSIQRELYAKLYAVNYVVQNFPYVGHDYLWKTTYGGNGDLCFWKNFHKYRAIIWYPNSRVNDDGHDDERNAYPHHYQWGIWALTLSKEKDHDCPGYNGAYPVNTGLFAPMDPGDPNTLGAYRYWFFTRNDFAKDTNNGQRPCYDASC